MISRLTLLMKQASTPTDADFQALNERFKKPFDTTIAGVPVSIPINPDQVDSGTLDQLISGVKKQNKTLLQTNPNAASDPNSGYINEAWLTPENWQRFMAWRKGQGTPVITGPQVYGNRPVNPGKSGNQTPAAGKPSQPPARPLPAWATDYPMLSQMNDLWQAYGTQGPDLMNQAQKLAPAAQSMGAYAQTAGVDTSNQQQVQRHQIPLQLAGWWGQNKAALLPWLIGGGGALGAMMLYSLFSRNQEERRKRDSDREVVYLK